MRTWKDVASLVRTKSLDGRFVARGAAGLSFSLKEGSEVAFVPPQTDLPRRGVVSLVRDLGDGSFEIAFDSVTDEDCARGLVGCHCLVRRVEVPDVLDYEEQDDFTGWAVVQADGQLVGEVADLVVNPAQMLLEVARPEGGSPVLVPVVDEIVADVDERNRTIVVNLPVGLLDL